MRNGTSTSDLTFDQLRSAFDRTASLAERARQFLVERTRLLQQQETPKPLITGPIRALHLIPLSGLAGRQAFDLQSIYSSSFTRLLEPDWGGGSRLFNLDGLVVYPGGSPEEGHYGYTQVFRIGAMEAASLAGGAYQADPSDPEKRYVWSLEMTKFFRERTGTLLALSKEHGFVGPAVLRYSVLHVTGYELGVESLFPRRHRAIPDRPHLVAPELWIESLESVSLDAVVRPLLDTLWQGFGLERCLDYDAQTGEYRPQRR